MSLVADTIQEKFSHRDFVFQGVCIANQFDFITPALVLTASFSLKEE